MIGVDSVVVDSMKGVEEGSRVLVHPQNEDSSATIPRSIARSLI